MGGGRGSCDDNTVAKTSYAYRPLGKAEDILPLPLESSNHLPFAVLECRTLVSPRRMQSQSSTRLGKAKSVFTIIQIGVAT